VTCAEFVELVTAYPEGALDRETEQRFVEHIAICDGCDRYFEQIRQDRHPIRFCCPRRPCPVRFA
jgi:Putative zinc-finger